MHGQHGCLYLLEDLFSRKIVGSQVFDCENAQLAAGLMQDICERQRIVPDQLTVHSDNGAPTRAQSMLASNMCEQIFHRRFASHSERAERSTIA